MKTRQGFVSNSSSSSFVVIGTHLSEKTIQKMGWMNKDGDITDKMPDNISILYDEDDCIVGEVISEGGDYLDNVELTANDLAVKFVKVQVALKRPKESDIKLLIGTRAC